MGAGRGMLILKGFLIDEGRDDGARRDGAGAQGGMFLLRFCTDCFRPEKEERLALGFMFFILHQTLIFDTSMVLNKQGQQKVKGRVRVTVKI